MAKAKQELTDTRVQGRHSPAARVHKLQRKPIPELLTVTELADVLRVTPEYVTRRLVFERRIRFIKVGRRTLFDAADVAAFIAQRTVTPEE